MNRRHWCSASGAYAVEVLTKHGLHFACRRYKYINHKVKTFFSVVQSKHLHSRRVTSMWGLHDTQFFD